MPEKTPLEFLHWKHELENELASGSCLIDTPKGPIEYAIRGDRGPVVVGEHGGPGGYDQVFAIWPHLPEEGFRLLSWSRPGYLRTPITVGRTYPEQADALSALLDALHIDQAAILGFSAGGTAAMSFALAYPDRVWALILESAVSLEYELVGHSMRESDFFTRLAFNDPAIWLYEKLAEYLPDMALKALVAMESTLHHQEARRVLTHILQDPEKVDILMNLIRSMSPISIRREGLENDLEQLKYAGALPIHRILAPTTIFHGTKDGDVSFEHATHIADAIVGAELCPVEGGFHILALSDSADEIAEKRLSALRQHQPPAQK